MKAPLRELRPRSIFPPNYLRFFGTVLLLVLSCFVHTRAGGQFSPSVVVSPGISFSTLSGPNGTPYAGHTEGDFDVAVTAGIWQQSLAYGNPIPSILDGPIGAPGVGTLFITDNVDLFTFGSLSFSSNNGDSSYDIQGFAGSTMTYHQTGTLAGSFTPFSFKTLLSDSPSLEFDSLLINIVPGDGVTSINLDNIGVATIPEPSTLAFLVMAVVAVTGRARIRN